MKIRIVSVGNKVENWLHNGIKNYEKKLPSYVSIEWIEIKPEKNLAQLKRKKKKRQLESKIQSKRVYMFALTNMEKFSLQ